MKTTLLLLPLLFIKSLSFSPPDILYSKNGYSESQTLTCYDDQYRLSIDHFDYKDVIDRFKHLKKSTIRKTTLYHTQCGLEVSIDRLAEEYIFKYNFFADIQCKNPVENNIVCEDSLRCSTRAVRCCQKNDTVPCNSYLFYQANIHGKHNIADLCAVRKDTKCYVIAYPDEVHHNTSTQNYLSNYISSIFTVLILYRNFFY